MKKEIKILKIAYIVIFVVGFLLWWNYNHQESAEIESKNYTYEITNIEEQENSITYEVEIKEKYTDNELIQICEEIKEDYKHLYKLNDVYDKVDSFDIVFYYEDEIFKEFSNK